MLENRVVLFGPYIGDIKEELFTFKPFVDWFKQNFQYKNLFVSTHYSSSFLYDDKVIPIYKQYSNDVQNQKNHLHYHINATDYQVIKKSIIDTITEVSKYKKSDLVVYDLGYSTVPSISFSQKLFKPINLSVPKEDFILYIDNSPPSKNIISDNLIVSDPDWSYEETVYNIIASKAVITPISHWVLLCNLHNKPVYTWGKGKSIFRSYYQFDNDWCKVMPNKKNINSFIEEVEKW